MSKHTSEPWEIKDSHTYIVVISNDPLRYAIVNGLDGDANARRIVACVNACAYIKDPQKFIDNTCDAVNKLMAQQLELIAAIEYLDHCGEYKDLIEKIKGE